MEIFLLAIIGVLFGVIIFQQILMYKTHAEAMDAMAQKAAGIYYPKDLRKQDLMEEKDRNDFVDINDIDDETFKKSVGLKEKENE